MLRKKDILEYYIVRHYGTDRIYIRDVKVRIRVRELTGNKTVTLQQIECISYLMGATPCEVLPPRSARATAPAPARDVYNAAGVVIDKRTGAAVRDSNGRAVRAAALSRDNGAPYMAPIE